jgi:hypothetical protein
MIMLMKCILKGIPDLPSGEGGNYCFGGDVTHRSGFKLKDSNPTILAPHLLFLSTIS